jgi:hypothetical protein
MSLVSFLLGLAPALVLLLALAGGRYPGERALSRLRNRPVPRPAAAPAPARPRRRSPRRRSGELLAEALAGRAPPSIPA